MNAEIERGRKTAPERRRSSAGVLASGQASATALAFISLLFLGAPPSLAASPPEPIVAFHPTISTPAAWPLGRFQAALDFKLRSCGQPGIKVDQKLGPQTAAGIKRLRACKDRPFAAGMNAGALDPATWSYVLGSEPFPSVADRARSLTYNFEGTDYTTFLWNVGQAADPHAWGTWGPFGATIGAGGEVQKIVGAIAREDRGKELLERAFATAASSGRRPHYAWRDIYCRTDGQPIAATPPSKTGLPLLLSLAAPISASDKRSLAREFCGDAYYVWPEAMLLLGSDAKVRTAYDNFYRDQNRLVANRLASIYRELSLVPTEIDWAFFFDRGTQFTTDLDAARRAIRALPSAASPAARRLAISRASRPVLLKQRSLRIARDVSFVIGAGHDLLTQRERALWRSYSGRSAESFGLSDSRKSEVNPFNQ